MEDKMIKVVVEKDYSALVTVGKYQIIVDEPVEAGGRNLGPDPYEYLMTALGSCTAITVRMYADRKNWKLDKIEVTLIHSRNHSSDCAACEDADSKLSKITKELKLTGDLADDQIKRLKIISSKCPIQKTLEAGIIIETK